MSSKQSLRLSGPLACFTRPELKAERVSYAVITPSAARGVLEAILWKPAIRWRVERIKVLAPIVFTSFRRNEVGTAAPAPSRSVINAGGAYARLAVEERRQQRNTVALRDVDYVIEARIELTEHAAADDNLPKFVEMFRRRVERGQHFQQPYFGCREFVAKAERVADDIPPPIDETRDLGLMLWDMSYLPVSSKKEKASLSWKSGKDVVKGSARPVYFSAMLHRGVLEVPPDVAAAEATLRNIDKHPFPEEAEK